MSRCCCSSRVWKVRAGSLLSFEKAAMELGCLFLHLLQHRHAFPGQPERFGERFTGQGARRNG